MLEYALLAFGFFSGVWFLRSFRSELYKLATRTLNVLNHLLSDLPEEQKVARVQKSTFGLLASLFISMVLIVGAISASLLPYWIFTSRIYGYGIIVPTGLWDIVAISLGASIPFFIPLKKSENGYSELSQLLHHLILDNYSLGLKLFKREVKNRKVLNIKPKKKFVIVTGLARAGTTSLMNHLATFEEFKSLSYANMPMLLSPNTWAKFYKPKNKELKERSHNDGIQIGLESNEALEEYFFKAISEDGFIDDKELVTYKLSETEHKQYLNYQTLVRQNENDIYLAKNNNFLLRYNSLRALNKEFVVAIMLREPLAHASSLLEKHKQYCQMQEDDEFVLDYMNWLGHHEFGINQKPFNFGNELPKGEKFKLDYWLQVWINYYTQVQNIEDAKCLIIDYNSYCQNPQQSVNAVSSTIGLDRQIESLQPFENKRLIKPECNEELLKKANSIYLKLSARHLA
ncbi:MAG: sulfotransferase family protein [Bacteroidia bacterium]